MPLTVCGPALGVNNQVFQDAMAVRVEVYVHEQKIALENEQDDDDRRSWHWVVYDEGRRPVGTIRLVPPPHSVHEEGPEHHTDPGNVIKFGRLATVKSARGRGVARLLVDAAATFARENPGEMAPKSGQGEWDGRCLIHAQTSAKSVWAKSGFVEDQEMGQWVEEGIVHIGMWRTVLEQP